MIKNQDNAYQLMVNVDEEVLELYRQLQLSFENITNAPTMDVFLNFLNKYPRSLYKALGEGEVHEEVFDQLLTDYREFIDR